MGDCSATCGITGLSTMGRKALLVPLAPNKHADSSVAGCVIVSNDGPRAVYSPIALPIFGRVDDYTRLEDVVEDENTAAILKWKRSTMDGDKADKYTIDTLIDSFCYGEDDSFGMYILESAWKKLSKKSLCGNYSNALDSDNVHAALELLGFVADGHDNNRKRYNIKFVHPSLKDFVVWADSCRSVELEYKGKEVNARVYRVKDLIAAVEKCGLNFPKTRVKALSQKHFFYPEIVQAKKKIKEYGDRFADTTTPSVESENSDATKLLHEANKLLRRCYMMDAPYILRLGDRYAETPQFDLIYDEKFMSGIFDNLFMGLSMLELNMRLINKLWGPTWHGLQYADKPAITNYNKLVCKLISGD